MAQERNLFDDELIEDDYGHNYNKGEQYISFPPHQI